MRRLNNIETSYHKSFFFFNDTATTDIYTLSLHDALPILQPSTTAAGVTISPAVQVTALDPAGNPVPGFAGNVTVVLGNNPGGSTLGGTTTIATVNGVASFSTLTLDKTGTSYWLTAAATGLNTATSGVFSITPGTATQLAFSQQPVTTVA